MITVFELDLGHSGDVTLGVDEPPEVAAEVVDRWPQWLWALLWEAGEPPVQVWVRCQAEQQPRDALYVRGAGAPTKGDAGVRIVMEPASLAHAAMMALPPGAQVTSAHRAPRAKRVDASPDRSSGLVSANAEPHGEIDADLAAGLRLLGAATRVQQPGLVTSAAESAPRRYMREREYAEYRAVGLSTVHKWRRLGLPTNGVQGRGVRIKVQEADAWLDAGGPDLALHDAAERHARRGNR